MWRAISIPIVLAIAAMSGVSAMAAPQPVVVGPYTLLTKAIYNLDYAVSTASSPPATQPAGGSETIVYIGLPSGISTTSSYALCQAQVDWFDWNNVPAGLSGPGFLPSGGGPVMLLAGQTLEYTSSINSANPGEYPPFTENIFRDVTNPKTSVTPFEGRAEVRILCPAGVAAPTALRVDAEVVTVTTNAAGQLDFHYKPVNVTKIIGLIGY